MAPKHRTNLARLDLNLLYTFQRFVEEGSVQGAARALGRSQPAISARLHQLEDELGVALFERRGRKLELTPFGRAFDARSQVLFGDVQALVDVARASKEEPVGVLRIGALPTVGVYRVAPRLAAFTRAHPGVEIELRYGASREQIAALQKGALDVVLGVGDPPSAPLDVDTLGIARPVLVTARSRAARLGRGQVSVARLRELDWVGFGAADDPFFGAVSSFFARHRLEPRVRVGHIQTLKALVASGAGVTILPDYTVVEPELVGRRIERLSFSQPIWIAARATPLPIVAAFRAALAAS